MYPPGSVPLRDPEHRPAVAHIREKEGIMPPKGGNLGAEDNSIPDTYSDTLDKNPRFVSSS